VALGVLLTVIVAFAIVSSPMLRATESTTTPVRIFVAVALLAPLSLMMGMPFAIGMRMDDRACGKFAGFAPQAKIVHIDIDPAEIGKNVRVDVPIVGDVARVLTRLAPEVHSDDLQSHAAWIEQIRDWREQYPPKQYPSDTPDVYQPQVIQAIYRATRGEAIVVAKHTLKNASIPILTITALQFGTLLGGAVVTETVFSWPGIGRLAVQSIYNRDYPVVQCTVFLAAVMFIIINFAVDLLYGVLDPRIRAG